jgi:hypothetical protein
MIRMRNILKVNATGNLVSYEKWLSRSGLTYIRGRLLVKEPQQMELEFSCFNKELNDRLLNEDLRGERVKVTGRLSIWQDSLSLTVFRLVKTNAIHDQAEFVAIGTLKEVMEDGELLNLLIEAKNLFKGKEDLRTLEITTNNSSSIRDKVLKAKGKQVIADGILKQVNDDLIICWLDSLDVLRDKILKAEKQLKEVRQND